MKYYVETATRKIELELSDIGEGQFELVLDEKVIQADFQSVGSQSQYACLIDGRSYAVSIEERAANNLLVTIGGETFTLKALDERERAACALASARRPSVETVKASMPGILVSLDVQVGDVLEPGQSVGILEAMKMQNGVSCQHGGVVGEVLVEAGQAVEGGQVLVRLEPPQDS